MKKEIVIYQSKSGKIEFRGDLKKDTIWGNLNQIAELFCGLLPAWIYDPSAPAPPSASSRPPNHEQTHCQTNPPLLPYPPPLWTVTLLVHGSFALPASRGGQSRRDSHL